MMRRTPALIAEGMVNGMSIGETGRHNMAITGMTDVAAATSALPMVAAISLGFSIAVLMDPERQMFDGSMLGMVDTLALACACALSVYTITFSLLEFYYIHMVAGAVCVEDARRADYYGARVPAAPVLAEQLVAAIEEFNGPRARARETMWYSLSALLLAVVARIGKDALRDFANDPIVLVGAALAAAILCAAVASIWKTVGKFREVYRTKVLGAHGYNW